MKENEYFNDSLYKNLKKFASFCIFSYNYLVWSYALEMESPKNGGATPAYFRELFANCVNPFNKDFHITQQACVPKTGAVFQNLIMEKCMTDNSIGMGEQDRSEREKFEGELKRIIKASEEADILLRVIGSLAFQMHCNEYGYLQEAMGRAYTDIDFAAYRKQTKEIKELMANLGYTENREVFIVSEGERSIFDRPQIGLHVDVFYEKLDFCHVIRWEDRLEVDSPTIPLAEMLLEKMQIVEINEKDIIDTIMLLLEHPWGDIDQETINIKRIAELCSTDWGLWRTTTMNLDKVRQLAQGYKQLKDEHKAHVEAQVAAALERIEQEPKSLAWRLRARVGDRVRWYKEVDEVE